MTRRSRHGLQGSRRHNTRGVRGELTVLDVQVRPAAREERSHASNAAPRKGCSGTSTAQEPAGTAGDTGRHWDCATTQGGNTCGPRVLEVKVKVPYVCCVVLVRTCWRCCATYIHTHVTRDTQRAVECVVEQVCMCVECGHSLFFRAR